MTLRALYRLGYKDEGASFLSWLLHTTRLTRPELQVVYNVYGEKHLEEQELKHLEGYAKSSPVRIGNNAAEQKQIDIYGEVLAAAYDFVQWGGQLDRSTRGLIVDLGKTVCRKWKEPDEGIWEIRAAPRHHTFSKAMCWVALDRILKLIGSGHLPIDAEGFQKERDAIRSQVESRGYSEKLKSYTSSFESEDLDASLLLLPVFGYIDGKHPRVRSTYERIQEQLGKNGLLFRYVSVSDGLPPGEGAFAIASFWDVECLALQGNLGQAKRKFEEILSFANHVGLFGEEIDPETGGALGNFPQAYTHVGLINAALTIADCESGKREA
jgi:GH15 family glucan-1,4-alpha-glucosidase